MNTARWLLGILLALFFLYMGVQKFIADPNPVFSLIADRSGIGLFEPVVRMLTGIAELFTALLLIAPKTRRYGAILGLLILIGAIGFHFSPWLGIDVPGIGTSLFMMALGGFVVNLIVLVLESRFSSKRPVSEV